MVNSVGRAKTIRFSLNFHKVMIGSLFNNKLLNNISLFMLIVLGGTKTLCRGEKL